MVNVLRNIPSVSELLAKPPLKKMVETVNHNTVVKGIREFLSRFREDVRAAAPDSLPQVGDLAERIADWIHGKRDDGLRRVINATGVLLHTGLGRAPLAEAAAKAMTEIATGYANLEIDLKSGNRSQRMEVVERSICDLTNAEAALVVNNNAGATLVVLSALARGQEVIVSRGHLVEIGGSYRLPDVMEASGARLREVGTTNKTRIGDFEQAIGENTGALLRVHTSNYRVVGFTAQPSLEELVALGRKHNLPVIDDIGSGALIDFAKYGFPDEPLASTSIKIGSDAVLFSGDKLLGGPQAGIVLGRRAIIDQIRPHPLMRALRVDKMTLAGLAATLDLYVDPDLAEQEVPLLAFLSTSEQNLKLRAERLAGQLDTLPELSAEAIADAAYLGGGSMPDEKLPTWCVKIAHAAFKVDRLAQALRLGHPSVFGRIQKDHLLIDLRCVPPRDDTVIADAVRSIGQRDGEETPTEEV